MFYIRIYKKHETYDFDLRITWVVKLYIQMNNKNSLLVLYLFIKLNVYYFADNCITNIRKHK